MLSNMIRATPSKASAPVVTAPTDGLIRQWEFTSVDANKKSYDSVANSPALLGGTASIVDGAARANANGAYVDFGADKALFNNTFQSKNFTLSFWYYLRSAATLDGYNGEAILFNQWETYNSSINEMIIWSKHVWTGTGADMLAFPQILNAWTHLCLTLTSGAASLYQNGQLKSTYANPPLYVCNQNPRFGTIAATGNYSTNADWDRFKLYNRGLSASEALSLFQEGRQ